MLSHTTSLEGAALIQVRAVALDAEHFHQRQNLQRANTEKHLKIVNIKCSLCVKALMGGVFPLHFHSESIFFLW